MHAHIWTCLKHKRGGPHGSNHFSERYRMLDSFQSAAKDRLVKKHRQSVHKMHLHDACICGSRAHYALWVVQWRGVVQYIYKCIYKCILAMHSGCLYWKAAHETDRQTHAIPWRKGLLMYFAHDIYGQPLFDENYYRLPTDIVHNSASCKRANTQECISTIWRLFPSPSSHTHIHT